MKNTAKEYLYKEYQNLSEFMANEISIKSKEKEFLDQVLTKLKGIIGEKKFAEYTFNSAIPNYENWKKELDEKCGDNIVKLSQELEKYSFKEETWTNFLKKTEIFSDETSGIFKEFIQETTENWGKFTFIYGRFAEEAQCLFDKRTFYKKLLKQKKKTQKDIANIISENISDDNFKIDSYDPDSIATAINKLLNNSDKRTGQNGIGLWEKMITALYGEKNDRYSYCKQQFIKEWADFWHKQVPQFSIDELIGTVEFYYDVPQLIQCKK